MTHPHMPIPPEFLDLFQKPAFAHLATIMPDGSPQITPVWVDFDGTYILVNSRVGRVKNNNMATRAQVAIEISDPDNPYRYLTIRGRVVEVVALNDTSHIDKLAQRYLGLEKYPWGAPDEQRQLFRIQPEKVTGRVVN
jgi:PPOX class probable F420-dependent enzyme